MDPPPEKRLWLFRSIWIWTAGILFVIGKKLNQMMEESEELQVVSTHVSIAWHQIHTLLYRYALESMENAVRSSKGILQTLGSVVFSNAGLWALTGSALLLCVFTVWRMYRRRRLSGRSTNMKDGGDDGMEILRTTKEWASTFDFFGTHTRERSGSMGDLSRGEMGEFRRERVGSMDLFYSQRSGEPMDVVPAKQTKDKQKKIKDDKPSKRKPKRKSSFATTPSHGDMPHDAFFAQQAFREGEGDHKEDEGYLFDEFGLVTLSYEIVYYGPAHTGFLYETWTPPTVWTEVSRRIIPQDIMLKLRRNLELDMNKGELTVKEPKSSGRWDFSLPAQEFSIHVEPPVEGAVMSLYVKGTPKQDWMEHSFESAQTAAQFQLDLLAYQVLGRTLNNMFQVLSLVHLGSQAYEGPEFVLHYNVSENKEEEIGVRQTALSGVAWDDAMRALSSIPTIRIALERLWLHHRRPNDDFNKTKKSATIDTDKVTQNSDDGLLTEEYSGKRLLLGPVDFFRLFVPALPDTALSQSESNRARMEQLLSWRKRAARAAVLIRAYAMSHRVVNVGWHLLHPAEEQPRTLRRRLAFDDNEDNNRRDANAKDEIYEASVSRDVLCHVRPFDYFSAAESGQRRDRGLVLSPYQAYALVGVHVFRKPEFYDPQFPLPASRDPVEALPSLQRLIANNSELDFFVACYHRDDTVSVMCYARSLAKGIDPQFDNVISRFAEGNKETRDRKVHMMVQIGQSQTLSFLGMILVRFLSFLFSLTRKGRESPLSLQARRDRIPFPAIRVASYGHTYHFGGAMQESATLPKNYVAMSMAFTPHGMPNMISRVLFTHLNDQISERVLDFTLVLEGEHENELPERALCTTRMVHIDTAAVAELPTIHDFHPPRRFQGDCRQLIQDETFPMWSQRLATEFASVVRNRLTIHGWAGQSTAVAPRLPTTVGFDGTFSPQARSTSPRNEDPIETAITEVENLLKGVEIPVKREHLSSSSDPIQFSRSISDLPDSMVLMLVLDIFSRQDIKSFILASNFDVKVASVRIVQTAAWRGETFPVDIRKCRIELQSGQSFQQGYDRLGNPVFYFFTMCRGPWRRNVKATISAVLHRFETAMAALCKEKPSTRCTFVVLLGRSEGVRNTKKSPATEIEQQNDDRDDDRSNEDQVELAEVGNGDSTSRVSSRHFVSNPRVATEEAWQLHSTHEIVEELISLLVLHYPERIARILLAKGKGRKAFYKTKLAATRAMKRAVKVPEGRKSLKFLLKLSSLRTFIDDDELSEAAGGSAPVHDKVFDFW